MRAIFEDLATQNLDGAVADDLVGVHVGLGAAWELLKKLGALNSTDTIHSQAGGSPDLYSQRQSLEELSKLLACPEAYNPGRSNHAVSVILQSC